VKRQLPADRFWAKVDRSGPDECWPWKAAARKKSQGYGAFWFEGRHQPANRMALIFSGVDVKDGLEACHSCDNPRCCNPKHLFPGTRLENNADKVSKRRHVHGEQVWTAKLTRKQVEEIRAYKVPGKPLPAGLPQRLADQFGISRQYVSEVIAGGWK
jgi:hypothetical protein